MVVEAKYDSSLYKASEICCSVFETVFQFLFANSNRAISHPVTFLRLAKVELDFCIQLSVSTILYIVCLCLAILICFDFYNFQVLRFLGFSFMTILNLPRMVFSFTTSGR